MRILKLALALAATFLLLWQLSIPHKAGDKNLPPLGSFFNPFTGFWQNADPAEGFRGKGLDAVLPGLKGKVEVVYDDLLVPHVFATNLEDAVRVQGYVTASQRLWQMDITTRKAAGRLSEVLGPRTLNTDRLARRRGMVFAAENNLLGWQKLPESMRLLEAYTDGINAYIDQLSPADYPIEFKLLDYAPEHWSVLKSSLVIESMAETLASTETDLAATNTLTQYGQPAFDSLYPEWNPKQTPIIPDTGQWKNLHVTLPQVSPPADLLSGVETPDDNLFSDNQLNGPDPYLRGSNNWAVSGERTKSGHPILANDPHLMLSLPSIWFQVQIHTPDQSCYGVSLPGVPGIIIGFNDDIAWGVTNVSHDVSDWYKIKWADAGHNTYDLDSEVRPVTTRIEEIGIKGRPSLFDTVRYTVFGPVVYDYDPKSPLRDCALRWISHDMPPPDGMMIFMLLNSGHNYADYKTAIGGFDCPAQNFVFASRSGDIAIQAQGRYPVRGHEQGRFVQDGSHWQNAWQDYIPQDQVPSMKNPSQDFVFSANQPSAAQTYPYYYLGGFDNYRGRRIHERLSALHDATIDSMKTMQLDNFNRRSADALPVMLKLLDRSRLDAEGRQLADEIAGWNYRYDADLLAPTLFETWWDSCYAKTWDEMYALFKTDRAVLFPEAWHTIELLEKDTSNRFFDHPGTPVHETARDIVLESFLSMEAYYHQNPDKKTSWGKAKGFAIKHLAQIDAFSRLDLIVGGHQNSPNAIKKNHGPSWRMIVELGDQVHALGVYPGGQSGNPGSRFYDNLVDTWAKGEYYDLLVMHSAEESPERILGKQTFSPK